MSVEILKGCNNNNKDRFAVSYALAPGTEKANSDNRVTIDEEISNRNDFQGSEENRSEMQHSTMAGPAMINYTL